MNSTEQQDDPDDCDKLLEEVGPFLDRMETLYEAAKSLDSDHDFSTSRAHHEDEDIRALFHRIKEEAGALNRHLSDFFGEDTEALDEDDPFFEEDLVDPDEPLELS